MNLKSVCQVRAGWSDHLPGTSLLPWLPESSEDTGYKADNQQNQKNIKNDLRDSSSPGGNPREAEHSGDQGNDEKSNDQS